MRSQAKRKGSIRSLTTAWTVFLKRSWRGVSISIMVFELVIEIHDKPHLLCKRSKLRISSCGGAPFIEIRNACQRPKGVFGASARQVSGELIGEKTRVQETMYV